MSFWQDQARRRAQHRGRRRWFVCLLVGILLAAGGLLGPELLTDLQLPAAAWYGALALGSLLALIGLFGWLYAALQPAPPPVQPIPAEERFGTIPRKGYDDSVKRPARHGRPPSAEKPRSKGSGRPPSPARKTPLPGKGKPDRRPPWARGS